MTQIVQLTEVDFMSLQLGTILMRGIGYASQVEALSADLQKAQERIAELEGEKKS